MPDEAELSHDELNALWSQERSDAIAAAIRATVPPLPHAMDYGCGPGHIGLRLLTHFDRLDLVDASADALAAASGRTAGLAGVRTFTLDLTTQDAPEPVDCAFASMSLHHIPATDAVLAGLARAVRAGGWLVVADLDADHGEFHCAEPDFDGHHGFDRHWLAGRIAAHGFVRPTISDVWAGHRWSGPLLVDYSVFLIAARRAAD